MSFEVAVGRVEMLVTWGREPRSIEKVLICSFWEQRHIRGLVFLVVVESCLPSCGVVPSKFLWDFVKESNRSPRASKPPFSK